MFTKNQTVSFFAVTSSLGKPTSSTQAQGGKQTFVKDRRVRARPAWKQLVYSLLNPTI